MGGLILVTKPTAEPLTTAQAKQHLREDASDQDLLVDAYVAAARSHCETFLKMSLLPTIWEFRVDGCFPWEIRLPLGPVLDVAAVEIKYDDDAGAEQTLATTQYQVSLGDTAVIRPAFGKTWPTVQPHMDAVRVRFTAGYTTPEDVPPAIMAALRLTLADFYEHRENSVAGAMTQLPVGARNLMMPFVRHD